LKLDRSLRTSFALTLALLVPRAALAQPYESDIAVADTHVREARRLLSRGRVMDACDEYLEADKTISRADTLLELSECYERAEFPGTAFDTLQRAQKLAHERGETAIEAEAARRMQRMGNFRSRIVVTVEPKAEVPGLEVHLDGHRIDVQTAGGHPVDPPLLTPGTHVLTATAPKYKEMRWEFKVGPGEEVKVAVPPLEREAPPSSPAAEVPFDSPTSGTAPVGKRAGIGLRINLSQMTAHYDLPKVPKQAAGPGWLTITNLQLSYAPSRLSFFLRNSLVYDALPAPLTEKALVASPSIGAAYAIPLGKQHTLTPSLTLTPSVGGGGGNDSSRSARITSGMAASWVGAGFNTNYATAGTAADLDLKFGRFQSILSARSSVAIRTRGELVSPLSESVAVGGRARPSFWILPWLGVYAEASWLHFFITAPNGFEDILRVSGGLQARVGKNLQLSAAYLHPLIGRQAESEMRAIDIGVGLAF
jgi:hypothetical protein